ncbi:MAG: ribonuclease II, partial [Treponema sp.]|nr:ribonuclease II [Treponema sp.]
MTRTDALVLYKNKPAIVKDFSDGKYTISLQDGAQVKVRDKDIELIHPGPVKSFSGIEAPKASSNAVREAWELLSDEGTPVSLEELASLVFGECTPSSAYAAYTVLQDGLYFSGTLDAILPRSREEAEAEEIKRNDKQREINERALFLDRIKSCLKKTSADFTQDNL